MHSNVGAAVVADPPARDPEPVAQGGREQRQFFPGRRGAVWQQLDPVDSAAGQSAEWHSVAVEPAAPGHSPAVPLDLQWTPEGAGATASGSAAAVRHESMPSNVRQQIRHERHQCPDPVPRLQESVVRGGGFGELIVY